MFDVAPYGAYVWPAYGLSAGALIGITLWAVIALRRARAKLKALETP